MNLMIVPERDSAGNVINRTAPFSTKEIDGKSLFKREHGVVQSCSVGTNTFSFVSTYSQAKMNEAKIVWQPKGCTADFKVYDDASGTYSGTPNQLLNQFGFGVGLKEGSHHSTCRYDADVYLGMKIECIITCPSGMVTQDICVNFILNELK